MAAWELTEPLSETIEALGLPILSKAAEAFVPWEVVTDPNTATSALKFITI